VAKHRQKTGRIPSMGNKDEANTRKIVGVDIQTTTSSGKRKKSSATTTKT
jgi:hypothetical protein